MSNNKFDTLKLRTLSSIFYVFVFLSAVILHNVTFLFFCLIIHCGCWLELQKIFSHIEIKLKHNNNLHNYGIIFASSAFILAILSLFTNGNLLVQQISWWLFLVCTFTIPLLDILFTHRHYINKFFFDIAGFCYLTLSFTFLVLLKFKFSIIFYNDMSLGTLIILIIIFSIWINDSLAYLGGSLFGKTPFFPNISPKKTWEGTLIGFIFSIIAVFIFSYFFMRSEKYFLTGLAVVSSLFGTIGDLIESKLKRMAKIKDSGNIMPGHGGFLDRFDSIIFASPFVFIYIIIIFSF